MTNLVVSDFAVINLDSIVGVFTSQVSQYHDEYYIEIILTGGDSKIYTYPTYEEMMERFGAISKLIQDAQIKK
jgi:hypothetical protein